MKFRRSAPLILISAIALVVVAASIISSLLFTNMISSVEEKQFSLMHSIVAFNLKGAEDRAQARAAMIADLPRARALFAAKDRAGLLAEYSKMFADQRDKYGVDQAPIWAAFYFAEIVSDGSHHSLSLSWNSSVSV